MFECFGKDERREILWFHSTVCYHAKEEFIHLLLQTFHIEN